MGYFEWKSYKHTDLQYYHLRENENAANDPMI